MKPSYSAAYDVARIVAILGVLIIHLWYPVYGRHDFLGGSAWWLAAIGYSASLVSVPLFVMVSGRLMLGRGFTIEQMWKRVAWRLVVPLLFWFGVYVWWHGELWRWGLEVWQLVSMLASGSMYHLYFLVILLGLYVLLPWFDRWLRSADDGEVRYGVGLALVVGMGMYLIMYLGLLNGGAMNLFTWWLPYVGFFLGGYLWPTKMSERDAKRSKWLFLVWLVFTLIMSYAGVEMKRWNLLVLWHDSGIYYFNTFLSPNVILMSVGLYVFLTRGIAWKRLRHPVVSKIISELSLATYGVYLVHVLVMDYIDLRWGYAIEFVETSLRDFMIERTTLVILLSFGIALILRRIPLVKRVVGEGV